MNMWADIVDVRQIVQRESAIIDCELYARNICVRRQAKHK